MKKGRIISLAGVLALLLMVSGSFFIPSSANQLPHQLLAIVTNSLLQQCHHAWDLTTHLHVELCAGLRAAADPICLTTQGSPLSSDCDEVAAYLLSIGEANISCSRNKNYPNMGDCQPLHTIGTCIASICGPLGTTINCTDAGHDVSTVSASCASGEPGNTNSAGYLIPYGNGNLKIQISQRALNTTRS